MRGPADPPPLAVWLLTKRLSAEWREFVLGDLEEEFATRCGQSPFAARAWFWWQAIRCLAAPPSARLDPPGLPTPEGDAVMMSAFLSDLRYAWRTVQRSPGFAVLVVAIMALGIGANTAVFSVVNGVLVKPLPYPGADRLVTLRTVFLATGSTQTLVSIANYRDWRDQSASFEAMATYRFGESPVASETTAEYGRTASVDAPFFRVLGVNPVLGRTFTPEETSPGTGRVAIISYAYWQRQFGGDRARARSHHPDGDHAALDRGRDAARASSSRARPMSGLRRRRAPPAGRGTTSLPSRGSNQALRSSRRAPT